MVKPYLLDVNVFIALVWPNHMHHSQARGWFDRTRSAGFRTCPITQLGFLRLFCNSKVTDVSMTPAAAESTLQTITRLPDHEFWNDDLPCSKLFEQMFVTGPKQFTDCYLIALAKHRGGLVATFDRGMLDSDHVESIG